MDLARPQPSNIADHVDALPPGTRLGEFEILALLGVGGFGMVYQAFDHSLLRFVAIKEYMPSALAGRAQGQSLCVRSSTDEQSYQTGLASFVNEARLLAQFDHPSLVKVFRFWEANRTAYMVMPLYSGMTLKEARLHMRTPPSEAWLRQVLWSVTSALRVLHDGQTLHRDVSPDNIFLQDSGPPVLLDLGAARRAIRERDTRYTAVLKINYAPIEQYAEANTRLPQGPWSDLYALGAVVHGCLCNDAPLPATLRAVSDRMVPFANVAETVRTQFGVAYSPAFVHAIGQCLALQPGDRPQTVDAFLQLLQMPAAPANLEHFDFRAALGDNWAPTPADTQTEPAEAAAAATVPLVDAAAYERTADLSAKAAPAPQAAAPPAAPSSVTILADTMAAAWTDAVQQAQDGSAQSPERGAQSFVAGPSRRRWGLWALGGGLAVLLTVGGWAWQSAQQRPRLTPESEIITELAEPRPAEAAQSQAPEPSTVAAESGETADAATAGTSAPSGVSAEVIPSAAWTIRTQGPAASVPPPAPVAAAPVASPAPQRVAPAPRPASNPAPAPAPAPARASGPEEACASASFLGRPLCIHQECQKPALASHPTCVAARRRQEEEARQRQMYPQ